jgi:hypothetical protein
MESKEQNPEPMSSPVKKLKLARVMDKMSQAKLAVPQPKIIVKNVTTKLVKHKMKKPKSIRLQK